MRKILILFLLVLNTSFAIAEEKQINNLTDYFEYLPHLLAVLKQGGILFADNVLFRGYVDGKVKTPHRFNTTKHSMENFLNGITNSQQLKTQIYDIEDGVSITEKLL